MQIATSSTRAVRPQHRKGGLDGPERLAERSFDETLAEIDEVAGRLGEALARTSLPDEPDRAAVDAFLVSAYRRVWGWS